MPYIPHTAAETREMLDRIGVRTLDDLFADIAPSMRPKSFNLPQGQSEAEVLARFTRLAQKNNLDVVSFAGAGFYDHYIPSAVDGLSGRSEFYTAYTPYQAESSQGTLQAIFEYQTAVSRLFDMECANASVYDGGSALFEAMMMAVRLTRRHKLVVDEAVNPFWRAMVASYTGNLPVDIVLVPQADGQTDMAALTAAVDNTCAAVVVQNPNFFGVAADYTALFAHAHAVGALGIISVNPVLQAVLKTPGEMDADIAVADGQPLGLPLAFGGPYLGIMTCKKSAVRQMPGRIVGRTHDVDGKVGYVLTLQAREQHIRRSKATSNICSNQALCALRSLMHLSLLGPEGLARTAEISMERARYAARTLSEVNGVRRLNDAPFGNEVALSLSMPAVAVVEAVARSGVVAGLPLGGYYRGMDNVLLVACTEKTTCDQIDTLAKLVRGAL